jgi:ABC-2 type transport system permease protein
MINVFRAELAKLTRPRVLLGTFVAVLFAAVVATSVAVFSVEASEGPAAGRGVSFEELEAAGGGSEAFALGISFSGFFVFVTLAANWAGEFSQGTFRTLLMKQPNRLSLLAGKLAGLVTFAAAVLLLFAGMTFVLSLALAPTQDVSTSAWFSLEGLTEAAGDYANAVLGVSAWASFAMMLGVLLRSTPVTLGVGIAWAGPFEHITGEAVSALSGIYPGLLLEALTVGGTSDAPYLQTLLLLSVYVVLAWTVSAVTFTRRDVTG